MQLNLRKARKLEQAIQKHLDSSQLNAKVDLRANGSGEMSELLLNEKRSQVLKRQAERLNLIAARFHLRAAIEETNTSVGISKLMNIRESIKAKLNEYASKLPGREEVRSDKDTLQDKLNAKAKQIELGKLTAYEGVSIQEGAMLAEDIDASVNNISILQRELEDVEDQLSQKNLGAKITLSPELETLLKAEKLI